MNAFSRIGSLHTNHVIQHQIAYKKIIHEPKFIISGFKEPG